MLCYKCNTQIPDYSLVCKNCGAEMSVKARQMGAAGFGSTDPLSGNIPQPMLWFTILVKFYLFVEAVSSFITAVDYIFGPFKFLSEAGVEEYLMTFSLLGAKYRIVDIIYGVLLVIFGIMALVVRGKLAKFKKEAPLLLVLFFIIPTLAGLGYAVAFLIVSHSFTPSDLLSLIMQSALQGGIAYANYVYFKKRKHLFKN